MWAHNSHVGDARATEMGTQDQLTLGQLVRERRPGECRIVGVQHVRGTVTAASDWGGPTERKTVRPGLRSSIEEILHDIGHDPSGL